MSVKNPKSVKRLMEKYENKIYVSLDIKDNIVMTGLKREIRTYTWRYINYIQSIKN